MKAKAIIIGNVVDVGGTMVASILLGIMGMVVKRFVEDGSTMSFLASHLIVSGKDSKPFLMAVGIFFSIYGGFVAARIAKEKEVLYGGLSTILCMVLGVFSMVSTHEYGIKHFLSKLLTLSLGIIGGYLQLRLKSRRGADNEGQHVAV